MPDYLEDLPAWQKARELSETHIGPLIVQADAAIRAYLPADPDARIFASLAALALAIILLWQILRRRKADTPVDPDLSHTTRRARLLVYFAGVTLLAVFADWASVAQLAGKARELGEAHIAPLIVKVDSVVRAYLPADPNARIFASLAALALVTIVLWRILRRRTALAPVDLDLPRTTRRARLLVYFSGVALLAAVADWTSHAQLASKARELSETHLAPLIVKADAVVRTYVPADPDARISASLAALALVMVFFWWILRRRKADAPANLDLPRTTRRARMLGYLSSVALVGVFVGWGSVAQIASAALAPGVVSPDGYRKTIQHLEGGIIKKMHVKEGDFVDAGDTLVTLDATQALARYQEFRGRYADLLAMEARLVAEQAGVKEISLPAALKDMTDVDSGRAIAGQIALFDSRRLALEGREKILRQRILQVEEEITGLGEMIDAQVKQLGLLDQEMKGVQKLLDIGLERLPRILALQRAKAEIETERAQNRARVARDHEQIGETQMQMIALREQNNERVNEDLTKVRGELAEIRSQLVSREDILARTKIVTPIAGTVMNMKITTESGVIRPGDSILDIVPKEAKLIIDAHVKPTDIDSVRPGMKTRVVLTAYRQRNLPQIYGVLESISADILFDEHARSSYFLAKVDVDPGSLEKLEDVHLTPGMPAEVMILNGEQTFLRYMLNPLSRSLTRSFREN